MAEWHPALLFWDLLQHLVRLTIEQYTVVTYTFLRQFIM